MIVYTYKAKQGPNRTVEGELAADSKESAARILESRGLIPVFVREKGQDSSGIVRVRGRIRVAEITLFTRQLASLLKSGLPMLKALSTVHSQTSNVAFARVVKDMELCVIDGSMLSEAMARYPTLFSELYVSMVKSGESAGLVDKMLFRLAEMREREAETRRKVQAAMAYPSLVILVGFVTVFVLLTFFMPKVVTLFKDFKDLPAPTKMLISLSGFFAATWYWMALFIAFLAAFIQRLTMLEKGRHAMDAIKLKLPLIGQFLLRQDLARMSRTLAQLIDAGVGIEKAIRLSADTMGNTVLSGAVKRAADLTVSQGAPFTDGLRKAGCFPAMFVNMAAIGEEGGRLDESLNEAALYYEQEIEQAGRMVTTLIEPILILVVGGIVGFIVAAMLLPIFKLSTGF